MSYEFLRDKVGAKICKKTSKSTDNGLLDDDEENDITDITPNDRKSMVGAGDDTLLDDPDIDAAR